MKKIFTLIAMMLVGTVSTFAQDTYTVAGVSDIVNGASWDQTNAENDMTEVETGIYQLVVTGCKLEAGRDYTYKVVKNHSWAESWPADNAVLTVEETAEYTVTFEFDEEWQDVSATAEKTGEYVVDPDAKTWTVAGSSVPLFGTSWDPANADNDMTKQADGTFKLVKKAVEVRVPSSIKWLPTTTGERPILRATLRSQFLRMAHTTSPSLSTQRHMP